MAVSRTCPKFWGAIPSWILWFRQNPYINLSWSQATFSTLNHQLLVSTSDCVHLSAFWFLNWKFSQSKRPFWKRLQIMHVLSHIYRKSCYLLVKLTGKMVCWLYTIQFSALRRCKHLYGWLFQKLCFYCLYNICHGGNRKGLLKAGLIKCSCCKMAKVARISYTQQTDCTQNCSKYTC